METQANWKQEFDKKILDIVTTALHTGAPSTLDCLTNPPEGESPKAYKVTIYIPGRAGVDERSKVSLEEAQERMIAIMGNQMAESLQEAFHDACTLNSFNLHQDNSMGFMVNGYSTGILSRRIALMVSQ